MIIIKNKYLWIQIIDYLQKKTEIDLCHSYMHNRGLLIVLE